MTTVIPNLSSLVTAPQRTECAYLASLDNKSVQPQGEGACDSTDLALFLWSTASHPTEDIHQTWLI